MRDFSLLSRDLPHLLLGSETNPKPCRASHAADLQKAAGSAGTKPQALLSAWLCGAGIAVPVSIVPGHLPGRRAQNRDLEAVTDRGKAKERLCCTAACREDSLQLSHPGHPVKWQQSPAAAWQHASCLGHRARQAKCLPPGKKFTGKTLPIHATLQDTADAALAVLQRAHAGTGLCSWRSHDQPRATPAGCRVRTELLHDLHRALFLGWEIQKGKKSASPSPSEVAK